MNEKMSATRALSELKMLKVRIDSAINTAPLKFIAIVKGKEGKALNNTDPDDAGLLANWNSVSDLMRRYEAIKAALVTSNAKTTVVIGGETMFVADAIERKRSVVDKARLLALLKTQLLQSNNYIKTQNDALEVKVDTQVAAVYGKDSKKTIEDKDYQSIRQPMLDQHELRLRDPLKLSECIEKLEKEINDFVLNVDYALSEQNAVTVLDVTY